MALFNSHLVVNFVIFVNQIHRDHNLLMILYVVVYAYFTTLPLPFEDIFIGLPKKGIAS